MLRERKAFLIWLTAMALFVVTPRSQCCSAS
jgi:hypothetical protein